MQRRDFLSVAGAAGALALSGCEAPPPPIEGGFTGIDVARGHALRDGALKGPSPATVKRTRVVIAGGGVAGLAAARALRLAGVDDFALLELEDTAGDDHARALHRGRRGALQGAIPHRMAARDIDAGEAPFDGRRRRLAACERQSTRRARRHAEEFAPLHDGASEP